MLVLRSIVEVRQSHHIIRVFMKYCVSKAKYVETTHRIVKLLQLRSLQYIIYLSVCKLQKSVKSVCNWRHWTMLLSAIISLYRGNSFRRFYKNRITFVLKYFFWSNEMAAIKNIVRRLQQWPKRDVENFCICKDCSGWSKLSELI